MDALILLSDHAKAGVVRDLCEEHGLNAAVSETADQLLLHVRHVSPLVIVVEFMRSTRQTTPSLRLLKDALSHPSAILVISSHDDLDECVRAGADYVITEPWNAEEIVSRVRDLVQITTANREARRYRR